MNTTRAPSSVIMYLLRAPHAVPRAREGLYPTLNRGLSNNLATVRAYNKLTVHCKRWEISHWTTPRLNQCSGSFAELLGNHLHTDMA